METISYQTSAKYFLENFNVLTDVEIEYFLSKVKKKYLRKADYFIHQGEVCNEVAIIISGSLRSYYISDEGVEITYCITFPVNFMTAYSSLITRDRTEENIQAITPVELLVISKDMIDDFASKSQNWMKFLKIIAEYQYIALEKRIFQLQKTNALQRYKDLLLHQPEYLQQIPLQYLASYLGVTQRHLSRIRKQVFF